MQKFPFIKRQIFTSPKGVSQIYPGYKWRFAEPETPTACKLGDPPKDCPGFDPRLRGWFMGTASTSKSIIIILDVSSSMGAYHRLENAIYATRSVINYLTEKDYVGIVLFNAGAFTCKKQTDFLLKATAQNKKTLIDCIENMMPFGSTNFEAAFNETFNLFDRSEELASSTCDRVVLFLTDGTITKGANPIPLIRKRNIEYQAKIFGFSLGSVADTEIPKRIACENRGLWSVIEDKRIQDLTTSMGSYYEYLSARYEERDATWIGPFGDVTGLGNVVTVSTSCSTSKGRFLGVALAAISARFIENSTEFKERAQRFTCPKKIPDEYLQMLRIEEGKSCNYCGYCMDEESSTSMWITIGTSTGVLLLVSFLLLLTSFWLCRKIYVRRKKWKMRKNMVNTLRYSNSWMDLTTSKRRLEKVRLPSKLGGEELELNNDYSSFRNI